MINMEENKTFTIKIASKEKYLEGIINQIDEIRFHQNIKNPQIELVFENISLNSKELYRLFDELVVHQEIVIQKIQFMMSKKENLEKNQLEKKDMVIVSPCNVHVVGNVAGTIILKHPADSIYSKEFIQCNAIIQGKAYYFDSCENFHFKKQS